MSTPEVPINSKTLTWARKTASASEEQAAKKAGVDVSRLQAWEAGEEHPTLAQLRHLADLYKRPLAFFLLDEVPNDFTVLKAFRRLPENDDLTLSFELAGQLRQALLRREIALDLGETIGDELTKFEPRASLASKPAEVATVVRKSVGISHSDQLGWADDYAAFRAWRRSVESLGVLTFQTTRVDVEEMRGLSVFQSVYPVVLLNAADAVRGRIFTLAHELGHLLLRTAATKDSTASLSDSTIEEEVWCNEFAGAFLVPAALVAWSPDQLTPTLFDWGELRAEANRLKVSQEVILRRLQAVGCLTRKQYQALRHELNRRTPWRKPGGGPVPQDVKVVSRLGIPFVRTVLVAYRQHRITLNDVSDYLDVRVKYVPGIEERVLKSDYAAEGADT